MEKSKNYSKREVLIGGNHIQLPGILTLPEGARAIVLFAHGSGSGRSSPRNQFVADILHERGIGTLLFDLLSPDEAENRSYVFAIDFLADRLLNAKRWMEQQPECSGLKIGYFGASTGAAAALLAASREPDRIFSVVSRGGRPDLAAPYLPSVAAPTLLIVGEKDEAVVDYNFSAMKSLKCTKRIELVPGASHLFEETGALERVANIAAEWFLEYSGEKSRKAIEKYEEKKIRKIAG